MLDDKTFKLIIEKTPLVSLDLCLIYNTQILLGKRTNEPLKGRWFTPGERIYKNEAWKDALLRIAKEELGLNQITIENFTLMGMWDHFYSNSFLDQNTSTHYVNLPHYAEFKSKPKIILDDQHGELKWLDLSKVYNNKKFHPYMQNYASWLLNNMENKDD